ncbi:MAG: Gfo/Idh/MocA family protein [Candidatus Hodarchaeota archaeon]
MTIKTGFIGFGGQAEGLCGLMMLLEGDEVDEDGDPMPLFEVVSFFDPSPDRKKAGRFGMQYFDDFEKMLAAEGDNALDAVVVASPPKFHVPQVLAALEKGLHVYSEVPMAMSIEDINKIIDVCKAAPNARYMLGENYEYHDDVKYAAALSRDGKLGDIFYAEMEYMHDIRYRWYKPKETSGIYAAGEDGKPKNPPWYSKMNPLMYAHSLGPLLKIIGKGNNRRPFVSVNARGNAKVDKITGAMNFTVALLETEDEVVTRVANAMVIIRKPARRCLNVYGSLGSFEAHEGDGLTPNRVFLSPGPSFEEFNSTEIRKVEKDEIRKVGGPDTAIGDWGKAITGKKPAAINEIYAAEQCAAGICAAESAQTRKQVEIPDFR